MAKNLTRILALILCAVMILGMIPLIGHAEEIQPRSITKIDDWEYTFETFEDLKELAAGSYTDVCFFKYVGSDTLVIAEDLSVTGDLYLSAPDASILIPEGVVFNAGAADIGSLTVKGTMTCYTLWAQKELRVDGTLSVRDNIQMGHNALLSGTENISFANDWGFIMQHILAESSDSLLTALETTAGASDIMEYTIDIVSSLEIPQSVTVPANTELTINAPVTIPAGISVTLYGALGIHNSLTLSGELNNQSGNRDAICVGYTDYDGGKLIFTDSGTITGNQRIAIDDYNGNLTDPQTAVPGLDLSNYTISEDEGHTFVLQRSDSLIKLGTPTDLQWGYDAYWTYDSETGEAYYDREPGHPGHASWALVMPIQNYASVDFYRVEESEDVWVCGTTFNFSANVVPGYRAVDIFVNSSPESGTYYFTVTSLGDYTEYADSETAVSDTWTYEKPEAKLGTCTNLRFDDTYTARWTAPAQEEYLYGYHKEWFFSESESAEPISMGSTWSQGDNTEGQLSDFDIRRFGPGYYYFRVRALTNDFTQYCNGDWSDLTLAYHVTEIPADIHDEFYAVMENPDLPAAEKAEQLRIMDTDALRYTIGQSSYAAGLIAEVEAELGCAAKVEVSDAVTDFDAARISVVGAGLNTVSDAGQGVTLVLDKPMEEHVIPSIYHNSVAVRFSMDLENVADTENLEIPVEITLPVPASINPDYLVILHYHADGTMEEIHPSLYMRHNQWYATFILTSFSDFIITEYQHEIPGDVNGDGAVDEIDVIELLWFTLFPEDYTITGDADFTGDGNVDEEDVVYLLWFTLFPEDYPL